VGDFWIDRYEAVIADETYWAAGGCGGPGNTYGNGPAYPGSFPFTGNWTAKLYACSKSGIKPSMGMTWFQAQEACAASGKRLCANEEWQAAAAGTFDQGSNNGSVNTRCNTQAGNKERNTGLAGDKPGDGDCCVSRWGAEDMIGNLWEWVAMWGQAGPDSGVANGQYIGRVDGTPAVEIGGFAGFSPETTGQGDGTWNVAGTATGCDRNGSACARKIGLPFAGVRGGDWGNGTKGGAFAISFDNGPSYNGSTVGFRCCRGF
jgi:formylglycine-generating enzyme required for sulfatase activity